MFLSQDKDLEGSQEPRRSVQTLEATWTSCTRLGIPVLCIGTKKKEMLGNIKRAGKTFSCQELAALDHDIVSFSNRT